MTRFRSFVVANVLLAAFAFALIANDRRNDDEAFDFGDAPLLIARPPPPLSAAEIARLRARAVELRTLTAPAVTAATVQRPKPKPTIAGPDLMTGTHVTLSQFRGKPVFVSVWNSQNVGSLEQASTIGRWARSHESQVAYLGIDSGDSQRDGRAFARRYQMTFPSIWDPVEKFYAWGYVPTTLVFDREHKLVQKTYGGATPAQLNAALRRVTRP